MQIQIRRPDDWHLHLRDGAALAAVLPFTVARFARAIVMPNLKPPVTTTAAALEYRARILDALPAGSEFTPLMTLYLTDRTDPAEIRRAKDSGAVFACKLYPAGATTNADSGVTDIRKIDAVLEAMSAASLPLLVHGEVTARDVDVFDREARFIDAVLAPTVDRFPDLRVVFEHITTKAAAEFVTSARDGVGATITPQHLLHNRNAIFESGIRPHYYCLPILKTEPDRAALLAAATSGNPRFFLGTDSAPHAQHTKENACGCAGMFSAHAGIELYAEAFDSVGKLDRLEGFASDFGADFYGLPRNSDLITLAKREWVPPPNYPMGDGKLVPMRAGEPVAWQLEEALPPVVPETAATTDPVKAPAPLMARRFRQFLPVVIDVETGGFNSATDALLEIAAVMIEFSPEGKLRRGESHSYHVRPFEGANLEPASLAVNGIDPWHPLRPAIPEKDALGRIFTEIRTAMKTQGCRRAILVGHNAAFDLGFMNAAVARAEIKRNPFHPFSCFDTATLAGAAFGQTVLAKAAQVCGVTWDSAAAHSAKYDAERTADIFCEVCNALDGVWRTADLKAQVLWGGAPLDE